MVVCPSCTTFLFPGINNCLFIILYNLWIIYSMSILVPCHRFCPASSSASLLRIFRPSALCPPAPRPSEGPPWPLPTSSPGQYLFLQSWPPLTSLRLEPHFLPSCLPLSWLLLDFWGVACLNPLGLCWTLTCLDVDIMFPGALKMLLPRLLAPRAAWGGQCQHDPWLCIFSIWFWFPLSLWKRVEPSLCLQCCEVSHACLDRGLVFLQFWGLSNLDSSDSPVDCFPFGCVPLFLLRVLLELLSVGVGVLNWSSDILSPFLSSLFKLWF